MDNTSILISVVIVLCIAAGVTAYGLTNDKNTVFNDLSGFTPDEQGNTGIGNNSTGLDSTGASGTGSGTSSGSGSGSSSQSSSSSSSSEHHNISPEKAKKIAEAEGWEGSWCYSVKYNSHGYYTCLLKDAQGRTGYVLVGSGTGTVLEGAWSDEVVPDADDDDDNSTDTNDTSNKTSESQ